MSSSQASPIEKKPFLYLVIKSGVPSSSSASRACQARSMPEIAFRLSKRKSSDVSSVGILSSMESDNQPRRPYYT